MPSRRTPRAFTLIELLVVITIIVVLLALLAPALDKAVYQAQLAVCGANLKGVGVGVNTYAMENNRLYPHRPTSAAGQYIVAICEGAAGDDRPYLRRAMSLKNLLCPLSGGIDLDSPPSGTWVISNYALWFSVKYPEWAGGGKGLRRMGDRLEFVDKSRGKVRNHRFSVLASDTDVILPSEPVVWSSHPETEYKVLFFLAWQNIAGQTFSSWRSGNWQRNPTDLNYVYTDGSVLRLNGVEWNDDGMARLPAFASGSAVPGEDASGLWTQLPFEE